MKPQPKTNFHVNGVILDSKVKHPVLPEKVVQSMHASKAAQGLLSGSAAECCDNAFRIKPWLHTPDVESGWQHENDVQLDFLMKKKRHKCLRPQRKDRPPHLVRGEHVEGSPED